MEHNFKNLQTHIVSMSVAQVWLEAKSEWTLDHVQVLEKDEKAEPETCPCGHFPIIELCWIRNIKNRRLTFVGNVCVKRFMGMPADAVAAGFTRVMENPEKALNAAAVNFSHAQGWISDWEKKFCLSTCLKRKLSGRQLQKRIEINAKLLSELRKRRGERSVDL